MAIVVTPLGANAIDGGFGGASPWVAGSGVTLGTGDVVVFVDTDNIATATGVTVGGVTATILGTTTSGLGTAWIATGVNTATGNVSIATTVGYNLVAANWFLITGEGTGTFTGNSLESFNSTDPSIITGTVPSGGVGLVSLGCAVGGGAANRNPTTWTNCVTSGNTTLEAFVATGNTYNIAGNYTTTSGSVTPNATGMGGRNYANSNTEMMMVTFAAAASSIVARGGIGKLIVPGLGPLKRFKPVLAFPPGNVALTLSAAQGIFTLSGKAATPNAARSIPAAFGTFALSGKATTLNRGIGMPAAKGTFTLNGIAASLPRARTMAAAQGAFTVSGIASGLFRGRTVNAAQGSFAVNGVAASLPVALSIRPVTGVFTINGRAAVLTYTPVSGGAAVSHSNPFFSTPGPGMALP